MSAAEFHCQHCEAMIQFAGTEIDAGIALACEKCHNVTIIDLFKPDERATMYANRDHVIQLGGAVAEAAAKAGIYNGEVPLHGPQVVHLAEQLGEHAIRQENKIVRMKQRAEEYRDKVATIRNEKHETQRAIETWFPVGNRVLALAFPESSHGKTVLQALDKLEGGDDRHKFLRGKLKKVHREKRRLVAEVIGLRVMLANRTAEAEAYRERASVLRLLTESVDLPSRDDFERLITEVSETRMVLRQRYGVDEIISTPDLARKIIEQVDACTMELDETCAKRDAIADIAIAAQKKALWWQHAHFAMEKRIYCHFGCTEGVTSHRVLVDQDEYAMQPCGAAGQCQCGFAGSFCKHGNALPDPDCGCGV